MKKKLPTVMRLGIRLEAFFNKIYKKISRVQL